ncbi:MAG TPA: mechanosensitive ion channel domain-containing protein [Solirubrobacteraceae bacterium]|jgi:small-conductance mechanosensitive channel|nr:mechanosensitive ion channel domain-containing protein [Solirubrobacteraceae bacterium]
MKPERAHRRTAWAAALGLSGRALRMARVKTGFLATLLIGLILFFEHRFAWTGESPSNPTNTLHHFNVPIRAAAVVAAVVLGWAFARDVPRALGPILLRHMDPSVAGTAGFLLRLATVAVTAIIAAGFAGEDLRGLLVGGAFTAVIVGLAAQQTLGNLIAGSVLLTARPFRVGERVRLQGAPGRIEGLVSTVGLLYTSFADGDERIMVPNSVVLNSALTPLREPDSVTLRARLRAGTKPGDLQRLIEDALTTPLRASPSVTLIELDGDEVIVQISATPMSSEDGAELASELLEVVARETPPSSDAADPAGPAEAEAAPTRSPAEQSAAADPAQPEGPEAAPKTR